MNNKIQTDAAKFINYDGFRKLFFFDLVLPQHLKEFYEQDDQNVGILKNFVFEDIDKALSSDLKRPDNIGVLLKLSMDNRDGTEMILFLGEGIN